MPTIIHVRHGERVAKFWLVPHVALASTWGMSSPELNQLRKTVEEKREDFERAWYERFA